MLPLLSTRGPPVPARLDQAAALLAEHFLERFRRELRKPRLALASDALTALRRHPRPGNVRELQNVMERAAILNDGEIHAADLGLAGKGFSCPKANSVQQFTESRVGAQVVKLGGFFQKLHKRGPLPICLLQPHHRLIFFAEL